jgi:hypothetical protein
VLAVKFADWHVSAAKLLSRNFAEEQLSDPRPTIDENYFAARLWKIAMRPKAASQGPAAFEQAPSDQSAGLSECGRRCVDRENDVQQAEGSNSR